MWTNFFPKHYRSKSGKVNFLPKVNKQIWIRFLVYFLDCLIGKYLQILWTFMWRKGHIGSEFLQSIFTRKWGKRKHFFDGLKNCFPSFWSAAEKFGRKRVIIQSQSNIDFVFILLPLTLSLLLRNKISIIEWY